MSRFSHYGSGQRLAFALLFVGFGLCLLGAFVPFWMKSEMNMPDLPGLGDFLDKVLDDFNLVKVNLGIWVLCIEVVEWDTKCYSTYSAHWEDEDLGHKRFEYDDAGFDWIQLVRVAIFVNIVLSLICGIAACCRCMCCSGGRTICHGVFAFLAGGIGIMAVAIMSAHKKDLMPVLPLFHLEYDWAFFVYAAGSGLLILASLFLCFSVPRETPGGVVMMPMPAALPYVSVTATNTNTVSVPANQYELNGQIQSFEPLPDQSTVKPPPPQY